MTLLLTGINTVGALIGKTAATVLWRLTGLSSPTLSSGNIVRATAFGSSIGTSIMSLSAIFCILCNEDEDIFLQHYRRRLLNRTYEWTGIMLATDLVCSFVWSALGAMYYNKKPNEVGYISVSTGIGADGLIFLIGLAYYLSRCIKKHIRSNQITAAPETNELQQPTPQAFPLPTPRSSQVFTPRPLEYSPRLELH